MYTLENHTIPIEDGEICVRTVSPTPTADETSDFPVLVFFHGGGWVVGGIDSRDSDLRILSVDLRLAIVNVGYRLAPEHPFPVGLNDCYAALRWVHGRKLPQNWRRCQKGVHCLRASAGANLAATVTHRSLKDPFFKDRRITGNVLQIPVLVHPAAYPPHNNILHGHARGYATELLSYKKNEDAPILSQALMDVFYDCLAGPPADPELSPLLADHNGLPPTHLRICGLDPLRDEGLLYERLLREQGILTRLDIYPGVPHGFSSMLLLG
ncbi:Alpha/Beta hydrolase protein [Mycena olivaceomarginata]|nr:Alpha/Beta hydrolase protein [Mycena olivaceomarginata]